ELPALEVEAAEAMARAEVIALQLARLLVLPDREIDLAELLVGRRELIALAGVLRVHEETLLVQGHHLFELRRILTHRARLSCLPGGRSSSRRVSGPPMPRPAPGGKGERTGSARPIAPEPVSRPSAHGPIAPRPAASAPVRGPSPPRAFEG